MSGVYLIFINTCLSTEILYYRCHFPAILQRERLCYLTSGTYFVEMFLSLPPTTRSPTRNKEVLLRVNYHFGLKAIVNTLPLATIL